MTSKNPRASADNFLQSAGSRARRGPGSDYTQSAARGRPLRRRCFCCAAMRSGTSEDGRNGPGVTEDDRQVRSRFRRHHLIPAQVPRLRWKTLLGVDYYLWMTGLLAITMVTVVGVCHGLPTPSRSNMSSSAVSHAVDFLTKYGYLPASDLETGNLRTEDQLRDAIKVMQKFGNIPQTGAIDEATLKLMKRRRCGMPDLIGTSERVKRYALQGQKWPSYNITWSVKEPVSNADPQMVRTQLGRAFKVWSDACKLTFVEVKGHSADIMVSFPQGSHGDGYPFDGEGAVLAHAFFPGEGIGGDAHFDAEERWLPNQPLEENEGVNLFAVAAHEIGHSLGLSHSSTPGSLMFPYYQVVDGDFILPEDDAAGIQQLYGSRQSMKWAPLPPVSVPPVSSGTPQGHKETSPTSKPAQPTETDYMMPQSTTKAPTTRPEVPTACNTSVDAISVIRREVFVFKGKYFWRLDANKGLRKGYPVPIDRFWYNLPSNIAGVDALYERPADTKIVFFSGSQYWLFAANQPEPNYPRPLTDLGLPADIEKIDAAMVWGHNGKTYLFSGSRYWRFDEADGIVELDYPRNMALWRGVPSHIDAAFQWTDGNTYFFKGKNFWKFNDIKMKVHDDMPGDISEFWMGCPSTTERLPTTTTTATLAVLESTLNKAESFHLSLYLCLISAFLAWHVYIL